VTRVATILSALALLVALAPATALADGDPASDTLLGHNVFYPYDPPVPGAVQRQLQTVANRAHRVKLEVRVALIARPVDLGVIPSLFGRPQRYAEYLEREISFHGPQPLIVVMYDGYGVEGFDAAADRAVASLPRPTGRKGHDSTQLARAAAAAIPVLARADGHPLDPAAAVSASNGPGSDTRRVLLIAMILAAVGIAALILRLRLRPPIDEARTPGKHR
jgi:hypothetical protein